MVPTIKYWKTLGPVSPPLLLYAANDGILVESGEPLKGLSNEEAEALRLCMAVQPARATGMWWAVHERAIARVVLARAGIVDADAEVDGGMGLGVVNEKSAVAEGRGGCRASSSPRLALGEHRLVAPSPTTPSATELHMHSGTDT